MVRILLPYSTSGSSSYDSINCARQMFIEDERGSISKGKYHDLLLVDKDVLSCPCHVTVIKG